jgi:hypothetical protein
MSTGCLGAETLCGLLEGRTDPGARARIEAHASRCEACRNVLSALARSGTPPVVRPAPELGRRALAPGAQVGRYVIAHEIGAGAMGIVHAAFDPDLERRIALKVLRGTAATSEARDRLLREARAMARLAHPGVVTVHEVGTAGGFDFVAMELIDGGTLADWLRSARRAPAAILDAFLAAGRGLAAAHAAGVVHRDFKPHNVLRSRAGRIAVTDFGLAHAAQPSPGPVLEPALPIEAGGSAPRGIDRIGAGSAPDRITATGALLGTPPYMAPEQWCGGAVTPATDQFAFCVALWEALAGERPYRGPRLDDLRDQVARGPAALDASRIPRRVRGLLVRGLDPDPARRWPSMDAVLARLSRARRGPGVALTVTGGALAAAAILGLALQPGGVRASTCEPPRDLAAVWSPAIAAELRAKTSEAHAAVLETAVRDWQTARAAACGAPPQVRQVQLLCLDGALARFAALREAFARVPEVAVEELQAQLVDPEICRKPTAGEVPRLTLASTPDVVAAYALYGRSQTERAPSEPELSALIDAPGADPCARVIATLAFAAASPGGLRARAAINDAISAADRCGDERVRADLLIRRIPYERERPIIGPRGEQAIQQAQAAASRVMQPDLAADLASHSLIVAQQRARWDEAFRLVETELAGYAARHLPRRQLQAALARNELRAARSEPRDLEAVVAEIPAWRPIAAATRRTELGWRLDLQGARARFALGDIAGGHADLVRLWRDRPGPAARAVVRPIEGIVVDDRGRPVPGATVAAASQLVADAVGIALPLTGGDDSLRVTTSDAAGRFVFHDAAMAGAVAAQLADRRSRPAVIAGHVQLVLEPTRRVTGRVDLAGTPCTRVRVVAEPVDVSALSFHDTAPVGPDGSFALAGVTPGAIRIGVAVRGPGSGHMEFGSILASSGQVDGVQLAVATSRRAIDVVIRSAVAAAIDGAEVFVIAGKQQLHDLGEIARLTANLYYRRAQPVAGDRLAGPLAGTAHSGDLVAHVEHADPGDLTVCAYSIPDLLDPAAQRRMTDRSRITVTCQQIGPDAEVVVLDVSPQPRFEP